MARRKKAARADKRMRNVATKVPERETATGVRIHRVQSRYLPPKKTNTVSLSSALANAGRIRSARQLDFLGAIPQTASQQANTKLHFAGDLSLLDRPCVAIVGTRQISEAGRKRTARLARELVEAGVVIVSGLAYGVDAVAHQTAIDCGGRTIAVIGTPLDKASPSENAKLQEEIYSNHLLISQFEPDSRTYRTNFPLRNRLMATLSDATVVMEASDTSGTLHQAAECTKLGRWLFIAKSVVDDKSLTWPKKFLHYKTCIPLEHASQITDRILS